MRRLYLFDGQTYVEISDSAWVDEVKKAPTGITALYAIHDDFIQKGWIKTGDNRASFIGSEREITWLHAESGEKLTVKVDEKGQVTVNGTPVGTTTELALLKKLEDIRTRMVTAKDGRRGVFINRSGRRVFIPKKDKGGLVAIDGEGQPYPAPEVITGVTKAVAVGRRIPDASAVLKQSTGIYRPNTITPTESLKSFSELVEAAAVATEKGDKDEAKGLVLQAYDKLKNGKQDFNQELIRKLQKLMISLGEEE